MTSSPASFGPLKTQIPPRSRTRLDHQTSHKKKNQSLALTSQPEISTSSVRDNHNITLKPSIFDKVVMSSGKQEHLESQFDFEI